MERYWSQHKVFFLATLALFPDKLTVQPLDPWFFSPYFNFSYSSSFNDDASKDPNLSWAIVILDDYQKGGYITYIKTGSLYKITEINTKKAKDDLMEYLEKWSQNKLESVSANIPPDASQQHNLLLDALASVYAGNHPARTRVRMVDIYGDPSSYDYEPSFWETVLSLQIVDKQVEITEFGYNRRQDGLYEENPQPYVDVKITDPELIDKISDNTVSQSTRNTILTEAESWWAELRVTNSSLYVFLESNGQYLVKNLRTGGAPLSFINYVLAHPDTNISKGDITSMVESCEDKNDMTELVRQCGFTGVLYPLKGAFFAGTTKTNVRLARRALLSAIQIKSITDNLTRSD